MNGGRGVMGWENPVDSAVVDGVAAHRTRAATSVADAVMWAGTTPAVLALAAVLVLAAVVALRAWRTAATMALALVAAAVTAATLKQLFERPRPPQELALVPTAGYSFPSTQAAETAAVAASLIVAMARGGRPASRPWAAVLVAAVITVGVSMVYLGAHWPTDVLAGWVLGALLGAAAGLAVGGVGPFRPPSWRR